MPRAPKQCGAPGCPERVVGVSYCAAHTKQATWAGSTRGQATGSAPWRALRARILTRDGHVCYLCGATGADTVDHIVPVSRGGTDDPANLAAVHDRNAPHCHRRKTGAEGAAARWGLRDT